MYENEAAGATLLALEVRSATAAWFSLEGGAGLFRLNPAAGLLAALAPLDYEAQSFYNLTVHAVNMVSASVARTSRTASLSLYYRYIMQENVNIFRMAYGFIPAWNAYCVMLVVAVELSF